MGMQGGGKVGGRHYVALLMSLLLMMAAWQTLAVAAEGDADLEAVAAEEVVPEVDEAVETDEAVKTDEAAATVDEEAAPEQDAQAEEVQEPAESDQVEEEVATDAAAPETEAEEQAGELDEQEDADDQLGGGLQTQSYGALYFADGAIKVERVSEGEVTYDEVNNMLILENATIHRLEIGTSITIELIGDNTVRNNLYLWGEGMTLTFDGEGILGYGGRLVAGKTYDYDYDLKYGYGYGYENYQCTGDVIVKGGTVDCREIYCKDFSISGGTVNCDVFADECHDDDKDEYYYAGVVTMSGGTVNGSVRAKSITMKSGSVSGDVGCSTFYMYDGAKLSAKGGEPLIDCKTFVMWGGTITLADCSKGINASEKFSMAAGTITVKSSPDNWDDAAINAGATFFMKGGTINTSRFSNAVSADTVTISGGTVRGDVDAKTATMKSGLVTGSIGASSFTMSGGSVTDGVGYDDDRVSSLAMSGGAVKGDIYAKTITMSKGSVTGRVDCLGTMKLSGGTITYVGPSSDDYSYGVGAATLSMAGGTIKVSKCNIGISVDKSFVMSKGTVSITSCDEGIVSIQFERTKTGNIAIKGGKVTITNPSEAGIYASNGNITMTGGTVSVTGSYGDALRAYGDTYRGVDYGGKIKITGGKLTAKVRKPSRNAALDATYGITNKASCLVAIAGRVDEGTSFKVGGNTYKVDEMWDLRLTKYESTKTKANLTTVKFGGRSYDVRGVAKDAFLTKQGKKVTSLSFGNMIEYLGSYAFKGTSSLTSLRLQLCTTEKWTGTTCKVSKMKSYGSYAKTAFKGAGKNGGKGLTVKCGRREASSAYRTYLRSLGLPSGAKVVGY